MSCMAKYVVDAIVANKDVHQGFHPDPGFFACLDVKNRLTVSSKTGKRELVPFLLRNSSCSFRV